MKKTNVSSPSSSWLLLAVLWGVLLLLAAWRPLALPDEGRYGEIGRWMLVSGDWLTPRLNGIPFFHKPPLLHWLEATAMGIFGVHAWAVRLVPALHAGLMLTALYLAARHIGGERLAQRATRNAHARLQHGIFDRRPVPQPRHAGGLLDRRGHLVFRRLVHAGRAARCALGADRLCGLRIGRPQQRHDWLCPAWSGLVDLADLDAPTAQDCAPALAARTGTV